MRAFPLPRAQQISLAEQLGAEATLDAHAADEQPAQHKQPNAARSHIRLLALPAASGQVHRGREAVLDRVGAAGRRERLDQIRILSQEATALRGGGSAQCTRARAPGAGGFGTRSR